MDGFQGRVAFPPQKPIVLGVYGKNLPAEGVRKKVVKRADSDGQLFLGGSDYGHSLGAERLAQLLFHNEGKRHEGLRVLA